MPRSDQGLGPSRLLGGRRAGATGLQQAMQFLRFPIGFRAHHLGLGFGAYGVGSTVQGAGVRVQGSGP